MGWGMGVERHYSMDLHEQDGRNAKFSEICVARFPVKIFTLGNPSMDK